MQVVSRSTMGRQNNSIPFRFVGSYEYDRALQLLTQLIASSTPEEIKVYDQVLENRAEFTFLNGEGLAFAKMGRPNLAIATPVEREKFNDTFKKKGLAWMMALARIELAATLSVYGDKKFPFEEVGVGEFDRHAFLEILLDDVVQHMQSLRNEPLFKMVMKRNYKSDTTTIAYLRRLKLVKDMLNTLARASRPEIASRIEPYFNELQKSEKFLVAQVLSKEKSDYRVASVNVPKTIDGGEVKIRIPGRCRFEARRLSNAPSTGHAMNPAEPAGNLFSGE